MVLEIKDNGCGFDTSLVERRGANIDGIGMRNMRERMERFNGRLSVQSSADGTVIEARLPRRKDTVSDDNTTVEAAA